MTCPFYHKLCGACKKYVCRGYFPEKQPYIKNDMILVCTGDNYEHECLIYPDAVAWREEKQRKGLGEHCPCASNAFCGKPWLWICKYAGDYLFLTDVEVDGRGLVAKDKDGNLMFKPGLGIENIKGTCLSGDTKIYAKCPKYKKETEYREHVKRVKKGESS